MLSKKMTFSLMSLITIFAFAFAVPSVMGAGEITPTLSADTDAYGEEITVTLTFDKPVGLANVNATPPIVMTVTDAGVSAVPTAGTGTIIDATTGAVTVAVKDTDTVAPGIQTDDKTFEFRIGAITAPVAGVGITRIIVNQPKAVKALDPASTEDSVAAGLIISLKVVAAPTADTPKVVSIQRLRPGSQTVTSAFQEQIIPAAPFDVKIVLTEHPNGIDIKTSTQAERDASAKNLVEVKNGVASNLFVGTLFSQGGTGAGTFMPHPTEGQYEHTLVGFPAGVAGSGNVPAPTSSDNSYRQYRVTITPHQKKGDPFDVKIRVKSFHDNGSRVRNTYVPASFDSDPNGREALRIKVRPIEVDLKAGYRVVIPHDIHIPGGGYLIVAKSKAGSEVDTTGQDADRTKDAPRATFRTPAQLKYNVVEAATLPNLATAFLNGVVVDVESKQKLVITEVMWGEDVSLNPSSNSQYIELYNPGAGFNTPNDDASTADIEERLTLVFYAPNEFADVPAKVAVAATATTPASMALPGRVKDRIGTLDAKGAYWSPATKGSSGRSGTGEAEATAARGEFVATVPIVSMYRGMEPDTSVGAAADAMKPSDGQMAGSWMSSEGPKSANFDPTAIGVRHGTPGAETDATDTPADTEADEKKKTDDAAAEAKKIASTGTMPTQGKIYISEVMFAGGGILPQWIEIANGSRIDDVNLSGWTLKIDNAAADTDVSVGATITFTIPDGTMIDKSGQTGATRTPSTILVVTERGRSDLGKGDGQVIVLNESGSSTEVDLILAGVTSRRYTLLSSEAFQITLAPPAPEKTQVSQLAAGATAAEKAAAKAADALDAGKRASATDMAGNLGADGAANWALPTSDEGRSSIIRTHISVSTGPAQPEDGEMMEGWVLASDTSFAQPTHIRTSSYYGAASDVGTPGFRAGSALPVELSHFRPERKKDTGAVVITWSTQSELNNAGFFIKRSQQKDGEFKVINAAMVPGAGTTSEKQFYTYTDTTAQPNVVYYYQIEDVSLDGNRQTLTRGIRLKGHVGAAGKATTLWGELKTSHE